MPRDIPTAMQIPSVKEMLGDIYDVRLQIGFPDVEPPYYPAGNRILVQLRTPVNFRSLPNGKKLWYADESVDHEKFRTQTALVRACGPSAFRHRSTLVPWPEGDWAKPGWFVRIPMYGGDRIAVPVPETDPHHDPDFKRTALFMCMNDTDVIGVITSADPLSITTLI